MRFVIATVLPGLLLLAALPAAAQHWNDSGPGRDLLSSTVTDFETFRQRTQNAVPATGPSALAPTQQRPPIPILDWVPPPANARQATGQSQARRRTTTPRRTAPRDPDYVATPAPAPARASTGGQDWERTLADRERELERLRRILEEDRSRYERSRQPQLQ